MDASTSGFALAEAFVRILPDADGFRAEADKDLKAQMAGDKVNIPVTAETGAAIRKIADLEAILKLLGKRAYSARLVADDAGLQAKLARIVAELRALDKRRAAPKVSLEGAARIEADVLAIAGQLDKISGTVAKAHVDIDDGDAERRLALLVTQLSAMSSRVTSLRVKVDDPDALARLAALKSALGLLHDQAVSISVATPDDAAIKHSLSLIASGMKSLGIADIADVNVDPGKIQASLIRLKTLLARTPGGGGLPGLADLMDINIPPSVVLTQLARLKEVMGKSGTTLTDILDVNLNDTQVQAAVAKLQKAFDNLSTENISIGIPTLPALAEIAKLRAALGSLVNATDFGQIVTAIETELGTALRDLGSEFSKTLTVKEAVAASVDTASWNAAAAEIQKLLNTIRLKALTPDFDQSGLDALIANVQAKLNSLAIKALNVGVDQTGLDALIASIQAKLDTLHAPVAAFNPDLGALRDAEALFAGLVTEVGKVDPAMQKATTATRGAAGGFGLLGRAAFGAGGWFGWLNTKVSLFGGAFSGVIPKIGLAGGAFGGLFTKIAQVGGAFGRLLPFLNKITVWHLLTESIIELAATLIPAGIAFAAWGAAASQTAVDLSKRITSIYTATQALSLPLPGLSDKFGQMAKSVQPQVYELLGEALITVNSKAGALQGVVQATGKVIDDLGARFTYAVTNGNTLSTIMKNAASDLAGWGNVIGNIGGIIGGVLKVLPGYAEIVLQALGDVTHALELVVNSQIGQALLSWGLAFHGAIVWIGLLATAIAFLASRSLTLLATTLAQVAGGLARIGASNAAGAMYGFAAASEEAAALPWGFIAIAAAGLGFLVYKLLSAKDAAQQFNASIQSVIQQSALPALSRTIGQAIAETNTRIAQSQGQVTQALKLTQPAVEGVASRYATSYNPALDQAVTATGHYRDGLTQLQQQQVLVRGRVSELGKEFGNNATALALLNAAGITSAQITDTNSQHWAEALIEVRAYNQSLVDVTGGSGRYLAAVNALNFAADDQANKLGLLDTDIAKVNQAQDQLIGTLVGAQLASDTYQQGLFTLAQNYDAAAGSGKSLADQLGTLGGQAKFTAATLTGTSAASVQLNASFYGQIQTAQKLFDALQLQNISTGDLGTVVATTAGQMLTWAGNNTEARGVVISLINDALGPGTVGFQNLNSWVAQNSTSMGGLNAIVAKTTINASQLANVLQGQLNTMLAISAANALGGQKALDQFANGVISGDSAATLLASDGGAKVIKMFLQMYQNSAPAAKKAFIDWAKNGLGVGQDAASNLWDFMTSHLQPTMGNFSNQIMPLAQQRFVSWARGGLGLGTTAATNLWTTLTGKLGPYLSNGLAASVLSSQRRFEQWAGPGGGSGLGLSRSQADKLYGSLRTLQGFINGMHGTSVPVKVILSATGKVHAIVNASGTFAAVQGGGEMVMQGFAGGGGVTGPGGPTADRVHIMASAGEWVINAASVAGLQRDYGPGVMAAINSYAAGGQVTVPGIDKGLLRADHWVGASGGAFGAQLGDAFTIAVNKAFQAAAAAAFGSGASVAAYARSFLGKIPYVWGGTSLLTGADCSGFTQAVLGHFSIIAPRTSEQQGAWVRRSPAVPGALAFYHSPPGGPDPGHVAIVQDPTTVISQGGGMGPQLESLRFLPLLWTGIPPGGYGPAGGQQGAGGTPAQNQALARSMMPLWSTGFEWGDWQALWNRESGWVQTADNPTSGAYGIPQALPFTKMPKAAWPASAGGMSSPAAQIGWGIDYIRSVYGDPLAAWAHELLFGWYAAGGPVDLTHLRHQRVPLPPVPGSATPPARGRRPAGPPAEAGGAGRAYGGPIMLDAGGVIPPGLSAVYNGTGDWETLYRATGGPIVIPEPFGSGGGHGPAVTGTLSAAQIQHLIVFGLGSPVAGVRAEARQLAAMRLDRSPLLQAVARRFAHELHELHEEHLERTRRAGHKAPPPVLPHRFGTGGGSGPATHGGTIIPVPFGSVGGSGPAVRGPIGPASHGAVTPIHFGSGGGSGAAVTGTLSAAQIQHLIVFGLGSVIGSVRAEAGLLAAMRLSRSPLLQETARTYASELHKLHEEHLRHRAAGGPIVIPKPFGAGGGSGPAITGTLSGAQIQHLIDFGLGSPVGSVRAQARQLAALRLDRSPLLQAAARDFAHELHKLHEEHLKHAGTTRSPLGPPSHGTVTPVRFGSGGGSGAAAGVTPVPFGSVGGSGPAVRGPIGPASHGAVNPVRFGGTGGSGPAVGGPLSAAQIQHLISFGLGSPVPGVRAEAGQLSALRLERSPLLQAVARSFARELHKLHEEHLAHRWMGGRAYWTGGQVKTMDAGGWLPPGLSSVYNGTGGWEALRREGGPPAVTTIQLEVSSTGGGGTFDEFLLRWLRENVRVKGGGNVQTAFGRRG